MMRGMTTADDVQIAVDALADSLGRSVLIEDVAQHPVWWSTRGKVDPTRMKTILHREVAPGAAAVVDTFRLAKATAPVRTPAMPEVDMWSRWCMPVRHEGKLRGYLWVLDPEETLHEDELQGLVDCAHLAGSVLTATLDSAERIRLIRDELLARLVAGPDQDAVPELARLQPVPHDAEIQVEAPAAAGGWTLGGDLSVHVTGTRRRLATSGAPLPLVELGEAVRRAVATRRVLRAGAKSHPPTWDNLGAWRLIADPPESVTVEAIHPAVPLLAEHGKSDLLTTARVVV